MPSNAATLTLKSADATTGIKIPEGATLTIGREPGNDIVLSDRTISRRQAMLQFGPGGVTLTHLGSASSTRVNGHPLSAGQTYLLSPGSEIEIGSYRLILQPTDEPGQLSVPQRLTSKERRRLKKLVKEKQERLHILEAVQEYMGERVEPKLLSDIADIQREIQSISDRLEADAAATAIEPRYEMPTTAYAATEGSVPHRFPRLSFEEVGDANETFEPLKEAGTLEINYAGGGLDLYELAVIQVNLQVIIDKVAFGLLQSTFSDSSFLSQYTANHRYLHIVRAEITGLRVGSLWQEIAFAVLSTITQQDVRSILGNLGASIIWAISVSAKDKVIRKKLPDKAPIILRKDSDADPSEELERILKVLPEDTDELHWIHKKPDGEILEVFISTGRHTKGTSNKMAIRNKDR